MKDVFFIIRKDLLVEFRNKGAISTVFLLAVLILFLVYFSVDPQKNYLQAVAPSALWVSILFAGIIGLDHFAKHEQKNDCLSALLSSPLPPWKLFLGKTTSIVLFLLTVEIVLAPCFFLLYGFSITLRSPLFFVLFLLVNTGIAIIGTLLSSLLYFGRASEFLLPLVMIPPLLPLLINAVQASKILLDSGVRLEQIKLPLLVLFGINTVFLSIGALLSPVIFNP